MNNLEEYYKIIDYRIENKLDASDNTEKHHITPRGFFEKESPKEIIDREENLVYLTSEEHFQVHFYLKEYYKSLKEQKHKDYDRRYYEVALKGFNAMGLEKTTREDLDVNSKLYEQGRQDLLQLYKEDNISFIKEVCEYYLENGKIPPRKEYPTSNNKFYTLMGLKKSGDYRFYDDYLEVAKECGVEGLFDTKEEKMIKNINHICDFVDEYGYFPTNENKKLYELLGSLRYNKKNNIYQDNDYNLIIEERGYPDLFEYGTYSRMDHSNENNITEKLGLENINLICDFIDEYGYVPIKNSKEPKDNENTLNRSLSHYRTLYKKKKTWFKSYEDLSMERGYPNLFEFNSYRKNFNSETIQKLNDICKFIDDNGYSPSNKSLDKYEKTLSNVVKHYRLKKKNNEYISEKYLEIITKRGYPDLFEAGTYPKRRKR